MAAPSYDYVFPAADSIAAQQAIGSATIDPTSLMNQISTSEAGNLYDSLNTAAGNSSQALTYGMYMYRNKTISDIASDLTKKNLSVNNGASDTYARQGEIDEWQAQNKLDTFFFLQCLFLYLTSVIILIFLQRFGIIPSSTIQMFIALFTIVLIGILWNRAYYTSQLRDKRYWNRRYLGLKDGGVYKAQSCSSSS
jgi:hypothetical protein|uniref:Uncharacterized protein n=1 Tax=viral metagenome TaxID=1070528 RepID=A0A6C0KN25_9ZZZZ